jgi:allophanate hydrolase subunit 1
LTLYPRVRPVGDAAVTVEFGEAIDPRLNAAVRALDHLLADRPLAGVVETVPTYRSLLVGYDPNRASFTQNGRRAAGTHVPRRFAPSPRSPANDPDRLWR